MQKIKKNLSAIQQKFQSLKAIHKQYGESTSIGEVAEIMTYGVVNGKQVEKYLEYVNSSQQIADSQKVNEDWFELNIQQMILFLDKVIKHRNINKPKQPEKKERLNLIPYKKIKIKKSNKQTHSNPYIPPKIGGIGGPDGYQNGNEMIPNQNQIIDEQSPYVSSEEQVEEKSPEIATQIVENKNGKQNLKQQKANQKQNFQLLDLPSDFKSYPIEERFIILLTKFSRNKDSLEKKFNMVYTHYRRQMYVPHQTFKANSDLLMDLRIFLKYYRQFDISKKFRANDATKHFKKLALNGIWLDFQNFIQIHYKLIELLTINDKQLTERLENGEINDKKKANELKKQLSKNAKFVMQNIMKLKQLTDLLSDQKIKKLLNDNTGKAIIKKIVEGHSGLVQEDILFRLKERIQEKKRKNLDLKSKEEINDRNDNYLKTENNDTPKSQNSSRLSRISNDKKGLIRSGPHILSVYQQLRIPDLGLRQMKRSSVYSSLQLLNMHKEHQRLRQLINEGQNQRYLQVYFQKQKQISSLFKSSNPIFLKEYHIQNRQKSISFSDKIKKTYKETYKLKNSLSLPKMKFS